MELGQFPLNLHIKNIIKLQTFYENFGFKACPEYGPADCVLHVPDANPILFNQF